MNSYIKVLLLTAITIQILFPKNVYPQPKILYPQGNIDKVSDTVSAKKYELKISLPKHIYKKFEPVITEIKMINHDSIPLELWGNFQPPDYWASAEIKDENGKVFSRDNSGIARWDIIRDKPTYIVQPNDTLYVQMAINNWGKRTRFITDKDNDIYFGNNGFFEVGKYSAHIYALLNAHYNWGDRFILKSNDVKFEVEGLNDSDEQILNLYKQADYYSNPKPYEEIINTFPDNPLTEHVYIDFLAAKYLNYYSNKNYKFINDLETDYQNFISKYPNSVYLLDDQFLKPYIHKHFFDINTNTLKGNFDKAYENFKSENQNNMLKYFFKDKRRTKIILGLE